MDIGDHEEIFRTAVPEMKDCSVDFSARYLGAIIGPESHKTRWRNPCDTIVKRSRWIRDQSSVCTSRAVGAYQSYVLGSVLFHAQFYRIDDSIMKAQRRALAIIYAAPFNSYTAAIAANLDTIRLRPFPDVTFHPHAALIRHALSVPHLLDFRQRIEETRNSDDSLLHPRVFNYWYEHSSTAANLSVFELGQEYLRHSDRGIVLPARPSIRTGYGEWEPMPQFDKLQRHMCKWLRSRNGSTDTLFHRQIVHKLLQRSGYLLTRRR